MKSETIERLGERARFASWRGDGLVAHLSPAAANPLSAEFVSCCVDRLRRLGYTSVVTSALSGSEAAGFVDAGFELYEELDLLSHELRSIPPVPPGLRRARRSDRRSVVTLDTLAFSAFWQLGPGGLGEALAATPRVRFRIATRERRVAGYAVTGRGAATGYLQRLAVHPGLRRQGIGRALVVDSLAWLHHRGAVRALVNTQRTNEAARALYLDCGFQLMPDGLRVLVRSL